MSLAFQCVGVMVQGGSGGAGVRAEEGCWRGHRGGFSQPQGEGGGSVDRQTGAFLSVLSVWVPPGDRVNPRPTAEPQASDNLPLSTAIR